MRAILHDPVFWLGWYLLVGILVYTMIPMSPKAREAFEMARGAHRHGDLLIIVMVSLLWPLIIIGKVVRLLRKL